jgi:hypothetical protein
MINRGLRPGRFAHEAITAWLQFCRVHVALVSVTTIRSTFAFSSVTMSILVSVVTFLLIAHLGESGNICYYPNGDTMGTDVPHDPDAPVTQCCGSRSVCLTNGLCALEAADDTGISYARGTCTDRSWSSPLCPQQFQLNQDTPTNSSAYDFRAGGVQVWQCVTEGYAQEAQFCLSLMPRSNSAARRRPQCSL